MKFSCQTCEDRVPGCHSDCEKYKSEKAKRKKLMAAYNETKDADYYRVGLVVEYNRKNALHKKRNVKIGRNRII